MGICRPHSGQARCLDLSTSFSWKALFLLTGPQPGRGTQGMVLLVDADPQPEAVVGLCSSRVTRPCECLAQYSAQQEPLRQQRRPHRLQGLLTEQSWLHRMPGRTWSRTGCTDG